MTDPTLASKPTPRTEATRPVRTLSPPVDIYENPEGFTILVDLPGVKTDGLSVEFDPPELRLRATTGDPNMVYERRFELGSGVDPETIGAELRHGVLRLVLKKSAGLRPRRIQVRAA